MHFIYIEVMKFTKKETELKSALDQWIYALKHASKMREEPRFLKAPELTNFFYLAKYANLTPEDRNMYRTAQQRAWDNYSILEYAKEEGLEVGLEKGLKAGASAEKREIALEMRRNGIDIDKIIKCTKLSKEQIDAL